MTKVQKLQHLNNEDITGSYTELFPSTCYDTIIICQAFVTYSLLLVRRKVHVESLHVTCFP
jgi:hypothetical protein